MSDDQYYSEKKDAEVGNVTVVPAGEDDYVSSFLSLPFVLAQIADS